jgi:hypothetical protein
MSNIEWIKLVSCGQYEHRKGLQIVDRDSTEAMIYYFNSLRGKLMRKFLGLPIYIGHPDDPEYGHPQNASIYGRVENLKAENNALWILVHWTDLGKRLFGGKFLRHLSPRWMMRKIEDRLFRPVRLISVGMTNRPNLCRGNDSSVDGSIQCAQFVENEENAHKIFPENTSENKALNHFPQDTVSSDILCANLFDLQKDANKILQKDAANLSVERPSDNLEQCVTGDGRLHVSSVTGNLSERAEEQSAKDKILTLVYERMANFCEDYQAAWNTVKHQYPALFTRKF